MIKKLFKLLRKVVIHKFWVAYYCFQIGLFWQGIVHDLSKFSLTEIKGVLNGSIKEQFSESFIHHKNHNPYHYEYWITPGDTPVEMPKKYAAEFVCNCLAYNRTIGGTIKDTMDWWMKISPSITMHEKTKFYIWRVLDYLSTKPNLYEAIGHANYVDKINAGSSVYSEFIKQFKNANSI